MTFLCKEEKKGCKTLENTHTCKWKCNISDLFLPVLFTQISITLFLISTGSPAEGCFWYSSITTSHLAATERPHRPRCVLYVCHKKAPQKMVFIASFSVSFTFPNLVYHKYKHSLLIFHCWKKWKIKLINHSTITYICFWKKRKGKVNTKYCKDKTRYCGG